MNHTPRQTISRILLPMLLTLLCLPFNLCAQSTKGNTVHSDIQSNKQNIMQSFAHYPIPDSVFTLMRGRSYKEGCPVKRDELRYVRVLHVNAKGKTIQGEMICHRDIADKVVEIFRELYEARYPIERMRLVDHYDADDELSMRANNTSCFNFRTALGSKRLSRHATGHAIDINPLYNPYVKTSGGTTICQPEGSLPYADRTKTFEYKVSQGDACHQAFIKRGFKWGGAWRTLKDWQHFEL